MAVHRYLLKARTDEFDQWRSAADELGLSLAAYIRLALNAASKGSVSEAPRTRPVTAGSGGKS